MNAASSATARALSGDVSSDDEDPTYRPDDDDEDKTGSVYTKMTPEKNAILSSGSDTEDEIERSIQRQLKRERDGAGKKSPPPPQTVTDADEDRDSVYSKTTDEDSQPTTVNDEPIPTISSLAPLPEFFSQKRFHLSGNVSAADVAKIECYIQVYGGQTIRNAAQADYIVSTRAKQVPGDFGGRVVQPQWVYECHEQERLVDVDPFAF